MSQRDYRELWYRGFSDAAKHADDSKESTGTIVKALQTLAKIEATYYNSIESLKSTYALRSYDRAASVEIAWEGFLDGLIREGEAHKQISEDLQFAASDLEKKWKVNNDKRKSTFTEGSNYMKDLADYENQVTKTKAAYQKAGKNAEESINRRDAGVHNPTKMQLADVLRMNEALETFVRTREQYWEAVADLQAAELVHRDNMIELMAHYEDIERNRIRDSSDCLKKVIEEREKEVLIKKTIPSAIAGIKAVIAKINDDADINAYVKKHEARLPKITIEFESFDTKQIIRNLAVEAWVDGERATVGDDPRGTARFTARSLPAPPPPLEYPKGIEIKGYNYRVGRDAPPRSGSITAGTSNILGKLFGGRAPSM